MYSLNVPEKKIQGKTWQEQLFTILYLGRYNSYYKTWVLDGGTQHGMLTLHSCHQWFLFFSFLFCTSWSSTTEDINPPKSYKLRPKCWWLSNSTFCMGAIARMHFWTISPLISISLGHINLKSTQSQYRHK